MSYFSTLVASTGPGRRNVFHRHLFLSIGLLTLCLFFLVAGQAGESETGSMVGTLPPNHATGQFSEAGAMRYLLTGLMRVLIVPMYPVWIVIAMAQVAIVGAAGLPGPLGAIVSGISMLAGLAPYAFADYLLGRGRRARATAPTLLGLH